MTVTRRGGLSASLALVASVALVLVLPATAAAQEPVKAFDQLDTRLRVGDTVWVTTARGAEVKGKIRALDAASIQLRGRDELTFREPEIREIFDRPPDRLSGGAVRGFLIGGGIGVALGLAAALGTSGNEAAAMLVAGGMGAGIGTAIGVGVDAAIPMPKRLVYRAGGGGPGARFSLTPVVASRVKGIAVSFAF